MNRIAHHRMVEGLGKMVRSKAQWISTFSAPDRSRPARPPHEIADAQELLAVLRQAEADYRAAAERNAA